MKQQKYNEYDVLYEGQNIARKTPTLRGSVMIYPHEAERLNVVARQTKLYYELAEEQKKAPVKDVQINDTDPKERRKELFRIARTEMNLTFQNTISTEDLEKLIEENKK